MDIQKIKDRIQKLLAMANDTSSPHEAAIAASRVQKLMAKYNLDMVDVIAQDILDEDNLIKAENVSQYRRTPRYISWIEVAIAQAFNCEVQGNWKTNNGVEYAVTEFYGYKTDVDVATSLCQYICDQLEKMAKRVTIPEFYRERRLSRRYMADWRKGAASEICDRIRDFYGDDDTKINDPVTSSGQSLVSLKQDLIEKKFGKFNYSRSRSYRYTVDGMMDGRSAAESISISRNINEASYALPDLS